MEGFERSDDLIVMGDGFDRLRMVFLFLIWDIVISGVIFRD